MNSDVKQRLLEVQAEMALLRVTLGDDHVAVQARSIAIDGVLVGQQRFDANALAALTAALEVEA